MLKKISCFIFVVLVLFAGKSFATEEEFLDQARKDMVGQQIIPRAIKDKQVIEAMRKVKRHLFVPDDMKLWAYHDQALPIGYDQMISQPYIVAYMTELAHLTKNDKVLEVGTGTGYQTAILAQIAKEVFTIGIVKPLAKRAEETLKSLGYTNVFIKQGDGYQGWPEHALFDAIIVTAATDDVPQELLKQLKVGGRMVLPINSRFQDLYLITKTKFGLKKEKLISVSFVPMVKSQKKEEKK